MIIQLQFSEIMGCANLFQRFLTLAVYCVSTPGTGSFRPESRSPPKSFRPYSRSPRVVSPSFINSALKKMKYKKYHCKYSYFGCCKACSWVLYFCLPHN